MDKNPTQQDSIMTRGSVTHVQIQEQGRLATSLDRGSVCLSHLSAPLLCHRPALANLVPYGE